MGISPYLAGLRSKLGSELILCPGVTAVVTRPAGSDVEILLVRRVDTGTWTLISGGIDPGEDPDNAVLREVLEETTIDVAIDRLLWVQMLPPSTYPNGDQVQYLDLAFRCHPLRGEAAVGDDESSDVRWFSPDALPALHPRLLRTIELALDPRQDGGPLFGVEERALRG